MKNLTITETCLMVMTLMFFGGCAGHRNLADNRLDGPRWAASYKQLKGDYATAGTADARNAVLDGLLDLTGKSPDKKSAALVKLTLCPLALSEGRSDILEGACADSEITKALLKR